VKEEYVGNERIEDMLGINFIREFEYQRMKKSCNSWRVHRHIGGRC